MTGTVITGLVRAAPVSVIIGAVSLKNVALYVTTVSLLSGVLVVGVLWGAAKAWRERAEARTDEAHQLAQEAKELARDAAERDRQIAELTGKVNELSKRPDYREMMSFIHDGHVEIIKAVSDNTAALRELANAGSRAAG